MRLIVFLLCLLATPALAAHPFSVQSGGEFPAQSATVLSTVQLTAPTSATLPVTFASVFEQGTTTKPSTDVANDQAEVLATWPDGSARLVQFTVRPTFSSGVPLDVTIYSTSEAEGEDLTPADINSAGLTASVFLDKTTGTDVDFSLGDLDLTDPDEITAQGPEMIEAIWRTNPTEDTDFLIETFIRYYADGRAHVRFVVSTGALGPTRDLDTNASFEKQYVPTVAIGGSTVWNNGAATFTHNEWAAFDVEGWDGGDPSVTRTIDTALMSSSGNFPTYWRSLGESDLDAQETAYVPGGVGDWEASMGSAGYQPGIGLMPNWDAAVIANDGDARAVTASRVHARAIKSYPISWVDVVTNQTVKPSDRADWTFYGSLSGTGGQGTTNLNTGGGLTYDIPHHGQPAKMAYALDGHPADYQTMRNIAAMCWLGQTSAPIYGGLSGTARIYYSENRSRAWCTRSLGDLAAFARPGDTIAAEYKTVLENNIAAQLAESNAVGQNDLGFFYLYVSGSSECAFVTSSGGCSTSKFMDYFWMATLGQLDEMNVFADETDLHDLMDNFYRVMVGLGGAGGSNEYCYNTAFNYILAVSDTNTSDPTTWYDDGATSAWKQAYDATCNDTNHAASCDAPLTACTNTLKNLSAPMQGQGGNFLTALAYLDLRYPSEAAAIYGRFTSASNWSTVANDTPAAIVWAIGDPEDFN